MSAPGTRRAPDNADRPAYEEGCGPCNSEWLLEATFTGNGEGRVFSTVACTEKATMFEAGVPSNVIDTTMPLMAGVMSSS